MRLDGKVAIISGAASGIGHATLQRFVAEGARVAALDRDVEALQTKLATMNGVLPIACDVADAASVASATDRAAAELGRIDIVAHFAGITRDAMAYKLDVDDFDLVLRVNLTGSFLVAREAARSMVEAGNGGSIVLTSSLSYLGNIGQANYAASKGGVVSLCRTLALEYGKYNIRVNALAPGFIETPMTRTVPDKVRERALTITPLKRTGRPEEIAAAALFLASDESTFITGQVLGIDGGRSVGIGPA